VKPFPGQVWHYVIKKGVLLNVDGKANQGGGVAVL
jgi:hypothetical protein